MQYGKEPPFLASLNRGRPGLGTSGRRVAAEVEDMYHAFPYGKGRRRRHIGRAPLPTMSLRSRRTVSSPPDGLMAPAPTFSGEEC
jgi:hypothetical protein